MFDDSSDSLKQFRFDIVDGRVVAFFEVENGIVEQESIESQDSFVIDGNQITHTKVKSNGVETTLFIDEDNDGFYTVLSESSTDDSGNSGGSSSDDGQTSNSGGRKAFEFDIVNGEVVSVFEVKDGQLKLDRIESNETYTVDGNDVIRTEVEAFGTEIHRFSDPDGDGQYQRVSEQWIPSSNSVNSSTREIVQTLSFVSTDDDDLIAVRGDDSVKGGLGSDSFVFRIEPSELNHWHIEDFHSSEGDRLVFDTGLGLTSKEHLASFITEAFFDGQSLFVGFTPEISITLVGVSPELLSWDNVDVLS